MTPRYLQIGPVLFDRTGRRIRLTADGGWVPLPERSARMLEVLAEAGEDGLTEAALVARAWDGAVVSPITVKKRASLLRQALGDDAAEPQLIQALRGRGYRLAVPAVEAEASPTRTPEPVRRAWWMAPATAGLTFALGLGAATAGDLWRAAGASCMPAEGQGLVGSVDFISDIPDADPGWTRSVERVLTRSGELGRGPMHMDQHLYREDGEVVLELTLSCPGKDPDRWQLLHLVDSDDPRFAVTPTLEMIERVGKVVREG